MRVNNRTTDESALLSTGMVSRRRLPLNFDERNRKLFNHELERTIPETRFLALNNVRISPDGMLFRGAQILPESFAFPSNVKLWRRRSLLKFFATNYLQRRTRSIERNVLWITD